MERVKICITCKEPLPLNEQYFNRTKRSKDGFKGECKVCVSKRNKEYKKCVINGSEKDKEEYFRRKKMLDERQMKCIELKAKGMNVSDIAKEVGISRTTYYEWNRLDEVKAEAAKLEQDFISSTRAAVVGYGPKAVSMLKNLAENAESEKIRLEATTKLLDKVISNATRIEIDDGRSDEAVSVDILDKELAEFDQE